MEWLISTYQPTISYQLTIYVKRKTIEILKMWTMKIFLYSAQKKYEIPEKFLPTFSGKIWCVLRDYFVSKKFKNRKRVLCTAYFTIYSLFVKPIKDVISLIKILPPTHEIGSQKVGTDLIFTK